MPEVKQEDKTILDKINECIRYQDASKCGEAVIVDEEATVNSLHKMICLECIENRNIGRREGLQDMDEAHEMESKGSNIHQFGLRPIFKLRKEYNQQ